LIGVVLVAALVLPLAAYAYFQLYSVIIPGVHIAELDVGGLTYQEALEGLNLVYGIDPQIELTDGTKVWIVKASELGLSWDTEATTQLALNLGHGKGFLQEIGEIRDSLSQGSTIEPILSFDNQEARKGLSAFSRNVDVQPVDATLTIEQGQVLVSSSEPGVELDIGRTLEALANDPKKVIQDRSLTLILSSKPAFVTDVSSAAADAENLLSTVVQVTGYDPIENVLSEWTIDRDQISSWLEVETDNGTPSVILKTEEINKFLEEINHSFDGGEFLQTEELVEPILSALGSESVIDARIYHSSTSYLVQEGDTLLKLGWRLEFPYWMIMDANPELYEVGLQTGQEITIPSKDALLPLPIVPNKRIVLSISEQRLWVFEDGELLREHIISTGIDRSPTQPGVFQVQTHDLNAYASVWDLTMPHFLGIYEAWPGFMNGLHGLPLLSNGKRLWADILGKPASFGCIILDLDAAEELYTWAENGVVVEIIE
jgi:hypothetical protein